MFIKNLVTFSLILFVAFIFSNSYVNASSILLYDDFNDGDANGWEEHLGYGGSWKVENGEYIGSVNSNSYGDASYSFAGNVNWNNYIFELNIKSVSGVDKNIAFRYNDLSNYYALNLISGSDTLVVGKTSPNDRWLKFIPNVYNYINTWYKIKIVLYGPSIKIYINNELKFEFVDDNQPILNGRIGLIAWPGASALTTISHFDDVKVTTLDSDIPPPTLTPTLTPTPIPLYVPYLSQRDPEWASDEYDHATNWIDSGEENTIDWWGCALTSGAMVARYFGVDKTPYGDALTPGTLNNWMKDQNDANFRNGAMNWQLLSRMSQKTAELFDTNKLDLSLSKTSDHSKLDEILTTRVDGFPGLPGILEVTHPISPSGKHFLVAKGKSDTTFAINDPYDDPASPVRNLLSITPYDNSFNKIVWYEPTHSNLSTILLVVDEPINIAMLDPAIHPTGEQFDLPPSGGHGNLDSVSGETLKMLYLDKPVSGYYSVGLNTTETTQKPYQLDIYLYDKTAEVEMATFVGWVGPGDQDNLTLKFDLDNVQNSQVTRDITFNTLREDIKLSHLLGWIENQGIATGLLAKVDAAENADEKENKKSAKNILGSLLPEIEALEEKQIDYLGSSLLENDVRTLLSQL